MIWDIIVPISISAVLFGLFIFLILPRPKHRALKKSRVYLDESEKACSMLLFHPTSENIRLLRRKLTISFSLLLETLQTGLGEIEGAYKDISASLEICKSLIALNSDRDTIIRFGQVISDKIASAKKKAMPFIAMYSKESEIVEWNRKLKAETCLKENEPPVECDKE